MTRIARTRSPCFRARPGAALALAAALLISPAAAVSETPEAGNVDPFALYGDEIHFDVLRAGDRIGSHRVRFTGDPGALRVTSEFDVEVRFLFVTAYSFSYRSQAEWRDGRLDRLDARVDDDGARQTISAVRNDDVVVVRSGATVSRAPSPLFPTNHWNYGVRSADRVLNTLTGKVNEVRLRPLGRETVTTERGPVPATRYAYTGELETEVWYDDAGRWVKLRFDGEDGKPVEFVCRRCQGPTRTASSQ